MEKYKRIPWDQKPKVIFILGGPGSGKGTQSELIEKQFSYVHLSAGDLLREERKNIQSEHGQLIEKYMVQGKIVPCSITVKLLQKAMVGHGYLGGKFLIDGFPRNRQNLRMWNMLTHPDVVVPFIVVLECGEECMMRRLLNRGKTSGRIDDKAQVIKKRFDTYNKQTKEVFEYFRKHNKLVSVNAENSVEETFKELKDKLRDRLIYSK